MTYKLNNTVHIMFTNGKEETIPCSYVSYRGGNGFSFSLSNPEPSFICIHGAQGTPIEKIRMDKIERVKVTDNPTEKEESAPEINEAAVENEFQRCIDEQDIAVQEEIVEESAA